MTKTLGVGIIGCGNISTTYLTLAPLFKGIEIRAVADLNRETATARAKDYGVTAQSVAELLRNDDIQIVVNLTVPAAHFEVSKAILEAGKHVYTEKPLTLGLAEARQLQRIARAKKLQVAGAPDTFLGGSHQLARKAVDDGLVGKIAGGTAHIMSRGMEHWHPNPDFFFKPGGGPVLDMGPYYITNLVDFASGAMVTLSASWDVYAHRHQHMELYGSNGALFLPDPNFFGGEVLAAGPDGEAKPLPAWDHPFGVPNQTHSGVALANYRAAGLADMAQGILKRRDIRCSIDRMAHVVDIMVSILKSGESRRFVTLATTCTRPKPLGPAEARALLRQPDKA